jgi:hypothetical protein
VALTVIIAYDISDDRRRSRVAANIQVWGDRVQRSVFLSTLEPVTAATRNCPETATKLPAGGHENCPLAVMGSARHDVVCLAASRG